MKKNNPWFLNPAVLVSAQLVGIPIATLGAVFLSDYPQTQSGIDFAIGLFVFVLGGLFILWAQMGVIIRIVLHNSNDQNWGAVFCHELNDLLLAFISAINLLWVKWLLPITSNYSNSEDYLF